MFDRYSQISEVDPNAGYAPSAVTNNQEIATPTPPPVPEPVVVQSRAIPEPVSIQTAASTPQLPAYEPSPALEVVPPTPAAPASPVLDMPEVVEQTPVPPPRMTPSPVAAAAIASTADKVGPASTASYRSPTSPIPSATAPSPVSSAQSPPPPLTIDTGRPTSVKAASPIPYQPAPPAAPSPIPAAPSPVPPAPPAKETNNNNLAPAVAAGAAAGAITAASLTPEPQDKGKGKPESISTGGASTARSGKRSEQTQAEIEKMRAKLISMGIMPKTQAGDLKKAPSTATEEASPAPVSATSPYTPETGTGMEAAAAGAAIGGATAFAIADSPAAPAGPTSMRGMTPTTPRLPSLSPGPQGRIVTADDLAAMGITPTGDENAGITPPGDYELASLPGTTNLNRGAGTVTSTVGGASAIIGGYGGDDDVASSIARGDEGNRADSILGGYAATSVYGGAGGQGADSLIGGYAGTAAGGTKSEFDPSGYYAGSTTGGPEMQSVNGAAASWAGYDPESILGVPQGPTTSPLPGSQAGSPLPPTGEWTGDAVTAMAIAGIGARDTPVQYNAPPIQPPQPAVPQAADGGPGADVDDILSGYDAATQTYDLQRWEFGSFGERFWEAFLCLEL